MATPKVTPESGIGLTRRSSLKQRQKRAEITTSPVKSREKNDDAPSINYETASKNGVDRNTESVVEGNGDNAVADAETRDDAPSSLEITPPKMVYVEQDGIVIGSDFEEHKPKSSWFDSGFCLNPFNCGAPASDPNEEEKSTSDITEIESFASVSTIGRVFSDLLSIPSVAEPKLPIEDDDEVIFAQLDSSLSKGERLHDRDDKSVATDDSISKSLKWDSESLKSGRTMNTETVESIVERKISMLRVDEELMSKSSLKSQRTGLSKRSTEGASQQDADALSTESASVESRRLYLVKELRRGMESYGRYDVRCADITAALGDLLMEHQEIEPALKLHKEAVAVYSAKLGDSHSTTIEAKIRLGTIMMEANDYDGAIEMYYQALAMNKALRGDRDISVSNVVTLIAKALRKKGRYMPAIRELKRALKMYREALGDSHQSVSRTVDEIASLYMQINDFAKASAILDEVAKLKAATMGVSHEEVASTLLRLATCHERAGLYPKAMKSLKKSYHIYCNLKGESSKEALDILASIARVYRALGEKEKTIAANLGVLRGKKKLLGDFHPGVAEAYFQLGVALRENGQFDKAYKCMKHALSIYVGEGKDMHDVRMIAEVMHEMANVHKDKQEPTDALRVLKQELAIRRKMGPKELPNVARTLNCLGATEFEIQNTTRALNYFMEALTIYEKREDDLGIDFAETLYNTGLVFESTKHRARTYDAFLEALKIFKQHGLPDDHPKVMGATSRLKKMGHTCICPVSDRCTSIPCKSHLTTTTEPKIPF